MSRAQFKKLGGSSGGNTFSAFTALAANGSFSVPAGSKFEGLVKVPNTGAAASIGNGVSTIISFNSNGTYTNCYPIVLCEGNYSFTTSGGCILSGVIIT